jgi:hypothetical protein
MINLDHQEEYLAASKYRVFVQEIFKIKSVPVRLAKGGTI